MLGVEVEGPRNSMLGREVLRHRSDPNQEWAKKLRSLVADLDTALRGSSPDALVVRSMDWAGARRESTARIRYQVEGAILAVASRYVDVVQSRSGREIGDICGSSKQAVDSEASAVFGDQLKEAGAAAIAALVLAEQA